MEGRGVTNYSANPSHGFTTKTSEFDDALLAREIITFEQAMLAKGASGEEAKRLSALKSEQDRAVANPTDVTYSAKNQGDKVNDDAEDTDACIEEFRSRRLQQIQHGSVIPISRTEWNREVNEGSHKQWVVITFTSTSSAPNLNKYHSETCRKVEDEIVPILAWKFSEVKWVKIPSKSAIENWPDDNLPTMFCYRGGKLQCQLVGLGDFGVITKENIEYKLGKLGVIETDIEVDPAKLHHTQSGQHQTSGNISNAQSYGRSKFQGGMATLATVADEELSDYDEVD
uniref:Phosducin thioredoxin-like domain-containing protein n=1 Tax=Chaetoceros debilis TaxID=122233 RepID=A0A7S3PYA5_9STRA|mmetsp:Transcript_110/g.139  ORF Transcript_110/g.139 Transcript_110/m.139 type:complete len:285 (-) Transcript_110:20-874(-)